MSSAGTLEICSLSLKTQGGGTEDYRTLCTQKHQPVNPILKNLNHERKEEISISQERKGTISVSYTHLTLPTTPYV